MFSFFRSFPDSDAPSLEKRRNPSASSPQLNSSNGLVDTAAWHVSEDLNNGESIQPKRLDVGLSSPSTSSYPSPSSLTGSVRCLSGTGVNSTAADLEYRMDYQLKESRYEITSLSALTVHTSYWSNADLAMFILMQIYPESAPRDTPLSLP